MITARLVGAEALAARLGALSSRLRGALGQATLRLGQELQERVRDDKLGGGVLQRRSGRLADSIAVSLEESGAMLGARLTSDVRYAAIHEYGGTIRAHEIKPQSARVLAFPWRGQRRFFTRVEIPAVEMPERSFLRSALADMAPEIGATLEAAARQAAQRL